MGRRLFPPPPHHGQWGFPLHRTIRRRLPHPPHWRQEASPSTAPKFSKTPTEGGTSPSTAATTGGFFNPPHGRQKAIYPSTAPSEGRFAFHRTMGRRLFPPPPHRRRRLFPSTAPMVGGHLPLHRTGGMSHSPSTGLMSGGISKFSKTPTEGGISPSTSPISPPSKPLSPQGPRPGLAMLTRCHRGAVPHCVPTRHSGCR